MAAKEGQKSFGCSMSIGSDEVFDISCDPCSSENIHLEAVRFCPTCMEYLCQNCYKYHGKLAATKNHKLLDRSSMPNTKVGVKVVDALTETCPKHTDKLLEYVCNEHNQLCCAVCLNLNHVKCTDKSYIPDVSDNITSGECKRLQADLDKLLSMATDCQRMTDFGGKENDGFQSKCLAKIRSLRKTIDEMLDKLQKKAEQHVKNLHKKNMDLITKTSADCQAVISELHNMISKINTKEKEAKKNQLYVDIKLFRQKMSKLEGHVKDMNNVRIENYEIPENDMLQEVESSMSAMLSVQQYSLTTTARYKCKINIKHNADRNCCFITGIAVLTGGRLVITDQNNNAVKLFDVKKNKVVSHFIVPAVPCDVIKTGEDKVAVSLKNDTIVLFDVSDVLSQIKNIQVPNTDICEICSYQDTFLITCRDQSCLRVIDMSGKVLETLEVGINGHSTCLEAIAINRDQSLIYVTDTNAGAVITLNTKGKILSVCKNDQLCGISRVIVGRLLNDVFVCCSENHTIHQLSPDGQYRRKLLGHEHGLVELPWTFTYSEEINELYINGGALPSDMNYIQIFTLE